MAQTEEKLLHMLSSPDTQRQAFETLVNQYSQKLYWTIRHIVLTHEDADDILQNTFLKAWTRLGDFKGNAKIYTWLYRIAVNEALDFIRHQKAMSFANATDGDGVANRLMADNYFDGDKTQALLHEAIAMLPDVQRTVFNLRYFDEMKYSDMCEILSTSEGALKASYHIAAKKVAEYIRQKIE